MHPILFQFGPITLYSYGLFLVLGFLAAMGLALQRARALRQDPSRIQTLGLLCLFAGIAGARLAYVIVYWDSFRGNLLEIFRLDHGGLVFYGGLGIGLLAGLLYIRRAALPVWLTIDLMIPPLVLGQAIGRIGCFMNGCCYGKPSSVAWAIAFPHEGIPRHPTQLYESAALILLFFLLQRIQRRQPKPGTILFCYGLLYGSWRFAIEFLRADNPIVGGGLTVFQWVSLPLAIVCGLALFKR